MARAASLASPTPEAWRGNILSARELRRAPHPTGDFFEVVHTDWSESTILEVSRVHTDFALLSALPSVDADYRFDRPKVYLSAHELARLTIIRSRLGDTRAEREAEDTRPLRRPAASRRRPAVRKDAFQDA